MYPPPFELDPRSALDLDARPLGIQLQPLRGARGRQDFEVVHDVGDAGLHLE